MNIVRPTVMLTVVTAVSAFVLAPAQASNKLYRRVAPATVAFVRANGAAAGTGVLVDAKKKLVLTAHHVVDALADKDLRVSVFFPMRKNGRIVTDSYTYANAFRKKDKNLIIRAKVLAFNPIKDLALVQLERIPAAIQGVPLAEREPEPGDDVHVIGNSTGGRGGVFGYNRGYVRNNFLHGRRSYCFYALCHQSPTNMGDSGGPVVNDKGELIAIISHGTTGLPALEQVVDYSVHLRELRAFLQGKHTYKQPCVLPTGKFISVNGVGFLNRQVDSLVFHSVKGESLSVVVKGKEESDLNLIVDRGLKNKAFRKAAELGDSDTEKITLQADWAGVARILVANLHARPLRDKFSKLIAAKKIKNMPKVTKFNPYHLEIHRAKAKTGPVTLVRNILPKQKDIIIFHYPASTKKARLTVYGDGRDDVDLAVLDPKKRLVARSDTFESRETVTWTPKTAGNYYIVISNLGTRRSSSGYFLMTD